MNKKIALLLILEMLLSLSACSGTTEKQNTTSASAENDNGVEISANADENFVSAQATSDFLPDRIEELDKGGVVPNGYQKTSLTKGKYSDISLTGNWRPEDDRPGEEAGYISFNTDIYASDEYMIEYFPTAMNFGLDETNFAASSSIAQPVTYAGFYTAEYYYITDAGSEMFTTVLYRISGDTLAIGFYETDGSNALIKVEEIDYQIEWIGWKLTLTYNNVSCTYIPHDIELDGEVTNGGDVVDGYESWNSIVGIYPWWPQIKCGYQDYADAEFQFNEDGTAAILTDEKEYSFSFRYSGEALTIIDSGIESVYATFADRDRQAIQDSVDATILDDLSESDIETIAVQHDAVLVKLKKAFESAGIDVEIDENTGTVTMDSSILFAVDDTTISDEGKALLDAFIDVYVPTILSDECVDYIAKIVIEGHTDTSGGYEYNQELSEKRAEAVAEYYKTESTNALSGAERQAFTEMLEIRGRSYDEPIYSENGQVDMDASRRVTFRFMMNITE